MRYEFYFICIEMATLLFLMHLNGIKYISLGITVRLSYS